MTEHTPHLKEKLLREIKRGEITMTPRFHFTLKLFGIVILALLALMTTIFLVNFIFFSIRINSDEALLAFGPRGIVAFLRFFPWPLLLVDIGLIALLQHLLRRFRTGYRIPIVYVVGGLVVVATMIGFAMDRATPLNDRLHARRDHLPRPAAKLYGGAERMPLREKGICRCTLLSIEGTVLRVQDTRGGATTTRTVMLPPNDRRATTTNLSVGDVLFIAGEERDGVIHAFGVRKEGDPGMRRTMR